MIQANEILLFVRTRLADLEAQKWSDEELIDHINSTLSSIALELECFTHKEYIYIKENEERYRLPHNVLKIISVNIDDKPVRIKSFEWLMQNKDKVDDICVSFDEQSFLLYPVEKLNTGQKVEIFYKYIEQIKDKKDFINISVLTKQAIQFNTLALAYHINTSEKNISKINHYLNLYDREIQKLKSIYFKNKQSKKIKSPFRNI